MQQKSPYIGVKYHIKIDHPDNEIALHNFPGGYCGISSVENGITNLCYLGNRAFLKQFGSIEKMEKEIVFQNPYLKRIFSEAEFIFDKPLVINEISFATKTPVEDHILMSGDSAGMITPLCGNGMAIAIRSAKILSEIVTMYLGDQISRSQMEILYTEAWNHNFSRRLWAGRKIQTFFGKYNLSEILLSTAKISPGLGNFLMAKTHGQPFE
jgi:flavin-dependent dehydrogenase